MSDKNQMSKSDASRIQSSQAKSGGPTGVDSFASRAQSAGDKKANAGASGKSTGGGGGGGKSAAKGSGGSVAKK